MPQNEKFTLPADYTFAPGGVFMHKDAYERLQVLIQKAQNRDPDAHNMYIYNDFFGYGVLDLVDETLSSLHTFVIKKEWMKSWHVISALSAFTDICPEWANVDDGPRVRLTDKTYGALMITTIRALESAGEFNEATIPDLELCLKRIAEWGDMFTSDLTSKYPKVIKGLGKQLFGSRTEEERTRMREERKEAYEEFVKRLSKTEREKRGDVLPSEQKDDEDDDDEDDDEDEDRDPWYGKAEGKDATLKHASFKFTPIWREYKNHIASVPRLPVRGPQMWDITKWPADAKKRFSFDSMGDDMD